MNRPSVVKVTEESIRAVFELSPAECEMEELFSQFRVRGACSHSQDAAGLCTLCVLKLFVLASKCKDQYSYIMSLRAVLREAIEVLDNYSDVNDGEDGSPVPNRAMAMMQVLDAALSSGMD